MHLELNLRSRVKLFKGNPLWDEVLVKKLFSVNETALLICDMWDIHFCTTASKRFDTLARRIAPVVDMARSKGVQIIHAPSQCMDFYKDSPHKKDMPRLSGAKLPTLPLKINEPPLPIDSSDLGCEDSPSCKPKSVWTRQHPLISIVESDVISDDATEINNLLYQRGINNLLFVGVAVNMCLLSRPFGIRRMTRRGIQCVLVRDLTDSVYNPKMFPFVSHDQGTELVVQHIEKYWCPSILSKDLLDN